ncbi:P-loop containing nucleoside triphosphate hydrolase protein [Rhexocercosporidium sp. MPI-PUGE-AT-0058]|nr:P-loop containing nucleoside triphosphate hydrolase protein [Rhexocercosporidium sp. MPI-PUGE-AT-0058]
MAGLESQVTFVQGPPGTGKSDVACTQAMWVACLGKNVLITAPTNAAGKSNATKLSKNLSQISWILRWKLQYVYFPTWKESIDRIFEHCGCQVAVVTQPGDDLFENFQIWRLVYDYAVQRVNSGHKDERAKNFIDPVYSLKVTGGDASMMTDTNRREELTSTFKHVAAQFLCQENINFILMSTCNNPAVLDRLAIKFDYIIIDEAGAGLEYDIAVTLQIKHEGVIILGDHLQGKPVIKSKGHNDFFDEASVSGFERAHSSPNKLPFRRKNCRWCGNIWRNSYSKRLVYPPGDAWYYQETRQRQKKYHRLALSVADGHSSPPVTGNSTVNYANVDAGLTFIMSLVEMTTITGKDIMIGTPFVSQADGGMSQGKEKRFMMADFTVANETEEAFLGFLKEWNRPNVLESRGQDVLVDLFNFELMQPRLESLYLQNSTWAYLLLDHLDAGGLYTTIGSSVLPASDEEYHGSRKSWTLVQRPSDVKKLYHNAIRPSQRIPKKDSDGRERYTTIEMRYVGEFADMRRRATAKIEGVLDSERKW